MSVQRQIVITFRDNGDSQFSDISVSTPETLPPPVLFNFLRYMVSEADAGEVAVSRVS